MSEQPLWLPTGSVRALLALVVVVSAVVAVFILSAEQAGLLLAFAGVVMIFYFEQRKGA